MQFGVRHDAALDRWIVERDCAELDGFDAAERRERGGNVLFRRLDGHVAHEQRARQVFVTLLAARVTRRRTRRERLLQKPRIVPVYQHSMSVSARTKCTADQR